MNIFYLDPDPIAAARHHCNRHVPKMIVETAQILSNAHWHNGYIGPNHVEHGTGPYRHCRNAGPTLGPMIWVMESLANYRWAVRLGLALCSEFERRFSGRPHKSKAVLEWLRDHEPDLPGIGATQPRLALDSGYEGYRDSADPVGSYRAYYRGWKREMKVWPKGEVPPWFRPMCGVLDAPVIDGCPDTSTLDLARPGCRDTYPASRMAEWPLVADRLGISECSQLFR